MQVKTINLTGEETEINFGREYVFVEINNSSNSEILISASPDIVRGNDDVMIISSRTIGTLGDVGIPKLKKIYAKGTGEIQVIGKDYAEHCFKLPAYGDGSDVKPTPEVLDFLPHPEGIYGYYDYAHGVKASSWENMIDGTKLECINECSFSVSNDELTVSGQNVISCYFPIKNSKETVIYAAINSGTSGQVRNVITNDLFNRKEEIKAGDVADVTILGFTSEEGANQMAFTVYKSTGNNLKNSVLTLRHTVPNNPCELTFALVVNNNRLDIVMYGGDVLETKHVIYENSISFTNYTGLYGGNYPDTQWWKIKSLMLSTEVVNLDNITENVKTLHNKYFPKN